ncbi:hypothetical protein ACFQY7_06690 [Actinomadura luteofluorescens]|uniref:hypothetical protein n=1 Tax=Actinomadura luteofluorescens TaxID=46163 RepID=UPI0036409E76
MIKSSVALPDEDTLEMPRSWMRHLHPRRGGHPGPKLASADVREDDLLARYAGRIEELLDHSKTDPALAAAAREHLESEGSALGAAAIVAVHGAEKAHLDPSRQEEALKRLRAFIAQSDDAEYRHIVSLLAGLRTTPARRILAAYLVPTELDWVAECCAAPANSVPREMLLRSLGPAEHLEILGAGAHISVSDCYYVENLITLADGVGPAIAPFMAEAFDLFHDSAPRRKGLLDVLSRLPGDETFRQMLERAGNLHMMAALRDSMRRFPVRAIRVLAAASAGDAKARDLLTDHLRAHAELTKQVLPDLPAGSRAVVEELWAADDRSPDAAADEVPRPLAVPRWERPEPKAKPVVVKGLPVPRERAMAWAPDERDDWLNRKIVTLVTGGHSFGRVPVPAAHTEGWARRVAEPGPRRPIWAGCSTGRARSWRRGPKTSSAPSWPNGSPTGATSRDWAGKGTPTTRIRGSASSSLGTSSTPSRSRSATRGRGPRTAPNCCCPSSTAMSRTRWRTGCSGARRRVVQRPPGSPGTEALRFPTSCRPRSAAPQGAQGRRARPAPHRRPGRPGRRPRLRACA